MKVLLLLLLTLILLYPFFKALKKREEFFQLPFLVSLTVFGFIFPTLFSNVNSSVLSDNEYQIFTLNIILCLIASYYGYYKKMKVSSKGFFITFNINKILKFTSPFLLIGFFISYFYINVNEMGGLTEGKDAILIYFSRLIRPTAVIVLFVFLLTKKKYAFILFTLYLLVSFRFIIISGRRSELFTLIITILLPLFFVKNYIPSKKAAIFGVLFGFMAFVLMPLIRVETKQNNFSNLLDLSYKETLVNYITSEQTNEVIEAAINVNIVWEYSGYSYGLRYINKFTKQFVSATIFGRDFKNSAQIEVYDLASARNTNIYNSDFKGYIPLTGFGDSFLDFGFLAFIPFYFFARLSKRLWLKAYLSKNIMFKMFYCYFVSIIFMSIYDSISFVPTNIILPLIVFYIISSYSKVHRYKLYH